MTVPLGARAAQFRQRHAFGGELLEQRQALARALALEAVEQALGGEVDRLAHAAREPTAPSRA